MKNSPNAVLSAALMLIAHMAVAGETESVSPAAEQVPATTAITSESAVPARPVLGKPVAGKGQVVFFRPSRMIGALISFKVRENEQELGLLKNGSYFAVDLEPGKHEFKVHSEVKDILPMEVDEGEVYYVSAILSVGLVAGRPNISPSDASAFQQAQPKMKESSL